MGKTRDLYKKVREIKGKLQAKIGMIKDRNGKDLSEAEDVKEICAEYVEDLYKKGLHNDRAPTADVNVNLELEPDILESEIQWALENMTDNKTSGHDEIPAELFKVTGKDAVKHQKHLVVRHALLISWQSSQVLMVSAASHALSREAAQTAPVL
ncbi:uncharacterized protein LOC126092932 [Schistocerca cancellata]|uniref:uncharacterized protein LOC126092932 n=1 Tax=Schistocerca cancellata TaxID=274614 RepID=UPI0021183632|nr:uncharacterized protein LOC126092932 [Schistocerca cancellata]